MQPQRRQKDCKIALLQSKLCSTAICGNVENKEAGKPLTAVYGHTLLVQGVFTTRDCALQKGRRHMSQFSNDVVRSTASSLVKNPL